MPRFTASAGSLLAELAKNLEGWKKDTLRLRLRNGLVAVNGKTERSGGRTLAPGDAVEVFSDTAECPSFPSFLGDPPCPVIHADDALLAINKPAGLLSVASEREKRLTAIRVMREWLSGDPAARPKDLQVVHRLDRETSGALLFARSRLHKEVIVRNWSLAEKTYLAVADGVPPDREGAITLPLWEDKALFVRASPHPDAEAAESRYRLLEERSGRSLLEIRILTGRKHQIRVHLAAIGCPVVGDLRYGVRKAPRLGLHAWKLSLPHPAGGKTVTITADEPAAFRRLLAGGSSRKKLQKPCAPPLRPADK